jgi:NADP-reducing hydrogenase subunit HndB
MAKMTLEELRQLRDAKKNDLRKRDAEGKEIQVIVGMGTCGIAAAKTITRRGDARSQLEAALPGAD